MDSFLGGAQALRGHPIVRISLTALVLTTAFTTGAIVNIDYGFVAIIDKANLLILIAFYASVLSLGINILIASFNYLLAALSAVFILISGLLRLLGLSIEGKFGWFRRKLSDWDLPLVLFSLAVAISAVTFLMYSINKDRSSLAWYESSRWPGMLVASLLILVAATSLIVVAQKRVPRKGFFAEYGNANINSMQAVIRIALLFASFAAGAAYVDFLRFAGPRVIAELQNESSERLLTVVFPASDGFIVFYDGDSSAYYLPIGRIKYISAR